MLQRISLVISISVCLLDGKAITPCRHLFIPPSVIELSIAYGWK